MFIWTKNINASSREDLGVFQIHGKARWRNTRACALDTKASAGDAFAGGAGGWPAGKEERAEEMGWVNRVVAKADLRDATDALAAQIASKSSYTLAVGKRAFYDQAEMSLTDAYEYASDVMVQNMLARDAEEGIGAFLEKRAPDWKDS